MTQSSPWLTRYAIRGMMKIMRKANLRELHFSESSAVTGLQDIDAAFLIDGTVIVLQRQYARPTDPMRTRVGFEVWQFAPPSRLVISDEQGYSNSWTGDAVSVVRQAVAFAVKYRMVAAWGIALGGGGP